MFDLSYTVEGVEPQLYAASPALAFKLRVECSEPSQSIHNVLLQCQLQIDSTRRRYSRQEQERLVDLFGEPERWSETLRAMLWTHASVMVPPFQGETSVEMHVPCTFDFNVAATKYFHGLDDGDVPLVLLFSGSIFYAAEGGGLRVARIPWEKEAKYRLPVAVWKALMDHYYPNAAWICLERGAFERLYEYKLRAGIPTWEQTIEALLDGRSADREAKTVTSIPAGDSTTQTCRGQAETQVR